MRTARRVLKLSGMNQIIGEWFLSTSSCALCLSEWIFMNLKYKARSLGIAWSGLMKLTMGWSESCDESENKN